MGPVFATRLVVYASERHPAETLFDESVTVCFDWFREVARRNGITLGESFRHDCDEQTGATQFRCESFALEDEQAWRAVGIHKFTSARPGDDVLLQTELEARDSGHGDVTITIRLLLGSSADSIQPLNYAVRPPRLITQLLNAFPDHVSSGNLKATDTVSLPTDADIQDLFQKLIDPARMVPLVVVSRQEDESLAVPYHQIESAARQLAGLARVYVLPSFAAGYALTTFLGQNRRLSCYMGAIRIYWPAFSLQDSPYYHPLWTVTRIAEERLHNQLTEVLFGTIAAASARAISADPATWRLYQSFIAHKQEQERDELRRQHQQTTEALSAQRQEMESLQSELLATLTEDYDRKSAELAQVTADLERTTHELEQQQEATLAKALAWLEEEQGKNREYLQLLKDEEATTDLLKVSLEEARDEIHKCRARVEALEYDRTGVDFEEKLSLLLKGGELRTTTAIIDYIRADADESYLVLLPEALRSVETYDYSGSIPEFLKTMMRIRRAAELFHDGSPLGHKELFESLGESGFAADASDTAKGVHADNYVRRAFINGKQTKVICGTHVKVGGNTPGTSIGIYWHIDNHERRYLVGHIGRHLKGKQDT